MALLGIKAVDAHTGHIITVTQGLPRTALLPLSAMILPLLLVVVGLWRHDGRMLHDVVAGTALIYKWNTAMAKFRAYASTSHSQPPTDDDNGNWHPVDNHHSPLLVHRSFSSSSHQSSSSLQPSRQSPTPMGYASFQEL